MRNGFENIQIRIANCSVSGGGGGGGGGLLPFGRTSSVAQTGVSPEVQ